VPRLSNRQTDNLDILNSNNQEGDDQNENEGEGQPVQLRNHRRDQANTLDLAGSVRPVSIHDRLSKLETAKTNWHAKVGQKDDVIATKDENETVQMRASGEKSLRPTATTAASVATSRPVSIHDRLSKLQVAQESWQNRVTEKDASKFTVAGKMQKTEMTEKVGKEYLESPAPALKLRLPVKRTVVGEEYVPTPEPARPTSTPVPKKEVRETAVPVVQDMGDFFQRRPLSAPDGDEVLPTATLEDLDAVRAETALLAVPRRTTRAPATKRGRPRSGNPVKQLAARTDLREVYLETAVLAEDDEEEAKGKSLFGKKHAHLAAEAMAGLASKEDFSNVVLRKNQDDAGEEKDLLPYKNDIMLIQIKGRRPCQARLVPPSASSVNSGDSFVLCTHEDVFLWQGRYSNVIERSKSGELAAAIYRVSDLIAYRECSQN